MAVNTRSFTAGRFCLDIDGQIAGFLKSIEGGACVAELAPHQLGVDNVQKKNIATIKYEPFSFEVGMGMTRGFYEWIQSAFDKKHVTKNGRVIAANFDYEAQSEQEFFGAYLTEVTIPAADGASKDPAYMTIKCDPERVVYRKSGGEKLKGNLGTKTKKWLCSNWRFELGGLPCDRVSKVDSFTVKWGVTLDQVGKFREPTKHPTKVEFPNLKITGSMADYENWRAWHEDFVIKGKCSDGDELTGSLTFLGPDMQEELLTVNFDHVGILSLKRAKATANEEKIASWEAELYVEEMKFLYKVTDL